VILAAIDSTLKRTNRVRSRPDERRRDRETEDRQREVEETEKQCFLTLLQKETNSDLRGVRHIRPLVREIEHPVLSRLDLSKKIR
jgi:hypothetical protein